MKTVDRFTCCAESNNDGEEAITRDSVRETLFEIAADMFPIKDDEKDDFEDIELDEVKCDSLDITEFVMGIECEFGIIVNEDEFEKLETFGDCIDLIMGKVSDDEISDDMEE